MPDVGARHTASDLTRLREHLMPLLSVIAGMVDLIALGNIFTAHVTGNLVLASAAAVRAS